MAWQVLVGERGTDWRLPPGTPYRHEVELCRCDTFFFSTWDVPFECSFPNLFSYLSELNIVKYVLYYNQWIITKCSLRCSKNHWTVRMWILAMFERWLSLNKVSWLKNKMFSFSFAYFFVLVRSFLSIYIYIHTHT